MNWQLCAKTMFTSMAAKGTCRHRRRAFHPYSLGSMGATYDKGPLLERQVLLLQRVQLMVSWWTHRLGGRSVWFSAMCWGYKYGYSLPTWGRKSWVKSDSRPLLSGTKVQASTLLERIKVQEQHCSYDAHWIPSVIYIVLLSWLSLQII